MAVLSFACGTPTSIRDAGLQGDSASEATLVPSATSVVPYQAVVLHDDHAAFSGSGYMATFAGSASTVVPVSPNDLAFAVPADAQIGVASLVVMTNSTTYQPITFMVGAPVPLPEPADQVIADAFSEARTNLAAGSAASLDPYQQALLNSLESNLDDVQASVAAMSPTGRLVIANALVANADAFAATSARSTTYFFSWPDFSHTLVRDSARLATAVAVGVVAAEIGFELGAFVVATPVLSIAVATTGGLWLARNYQTVGDDVASTVNTTFTNIIEEVTSGAQSPPSDVIDDTGDTGDTGNVRVRRRNTLTLSPVMFDDMQVTTLQFHVERDHLVAADIHSTNTTLRQAAIAFGNLSSELSEVGAAMPDGFPVTPQLASSATPVINDADATLLTPGAVTPSSLTMTSFSPSGATLGVAFTADVSQPFTFALVYAGDVGAETLTIPAMFSKCFDVFVSTCSPGSGAPSQCPVGDTVGACTQLGSGHQVSCCGPVAP